MLMQMIDSLPRKFENAVFEQHSLRQALGYAAIGANVNRDGHGDPWLTQACLSNDLKAAKILLKLGGKAEIRQSDSSWPNARLSQTVLFHAQSPEMAALLISHGANPMATAMTADGGLDTALGIHIFCNRLEVAKVLLSHGADPDFCADPIQRHPPLHEAVAQADLRWVEGLLECGANPFKKNRYNRTPAEFAAYLDSGNFGEWGKIAVRLSQAELQFLAKNEKKELENALECGGEELAAKPRAKRL